MLFEDVDKEQLTRLLPKENLSKNIWKNKSLKPGIGTALANIAEEFISFIGIEVTVRDITLVGRRA